MNDDETATTEQTQAHVEEQTQDQALAAAARSRRAMSTWAIDVRPGLVEEISTAALLERGPFPNGGVEIGGILLGYLARRTVVVESWISVRCEHAHGPALILSDADRQRVQELLAAHKPLTAQSSGPVGWVVSRPYGETLPSEPDLDVFGEFFSEPWHLLMVVKPEAPQRAHAAFFVRDPDGTLNPFRAYRELDASPPPALPERHESFEPAASLVALRAGVAGEEAGTAAHNLPSTEPVPSPRRLAAWEQEPRPVRSPLRWAWLALPAVAIATAILVFGVLLGSTEAEPVDLTLNDADNQLVIRWATPPDVLSGADFGSLMIRDGDAQRAIRLGRTDLRRGSATYVRQSGDIRVDLTVWNHGRRHTGVAAFLGAPVRRRPVDTAPLDQLRRENAALRAQATRAAARANSSENLVRILRNRLALLGTGGVAQR